MAKYPDRVAEQRQEVVEMIIKDMSERGYEWIQAFTLGTSPNNPISGSTYKGGNRLHLTFIANKRGYEDPRWATFNQAKKAGYQMKKGAKSAIVEKWKVFKFKTEDPADPENELTKSFLKCVGYWSVFNFSELKGAPEWVAPDYSVKTDEASSIADSFIASSRCGIAECESDRACYNPISDTINIPLRGQFTDNQAFLRVLWHEMTHSTMHAGTPATRDAGNVHDMQRYAYEELVAELGSVFIGNDCGFKSSHDENSNHYKQHLAYLQSWIKALQDDPSYIFKAASMAAKASEYLVSNYNDLSAT